MTWQCCSVHMQVPSLGARVTGPTAPSLLWSPCLWHTGYDCTFCMVHLTTASPSSYKKTQETLSQAGQKTSAALSTMGSAISRKLGDMR